MNENIMQNKPPMESHKITLSFMVILNIDAKNLIVHFMIL